MMEKRIIALTMMLIIQFTLIVNVNSQGVCSEVNRIIEINENYAKIRDEINISGVCVNITEYIPKQYSNMIFIVKAYDENGERKISMEEGLEDVGITVIGEVRNRLTLELYLIAHVQAIQDGYSFQFPLYPNLNIMVEECRVSVYYPKGTLEVKTIIPSANVTWGEKPKIEYHQSPLPPETKIELYTSFKAKITPITIDRISRIVSLTQELNVKDSILIRNLSGGKISKNNGIKIVMPSNTYVKYVSDALGRLNYKTNITGEGLEVTVYPRIDIQSGWTYEFTLEYTLQRGDYVIEGQQETLNIPINTILKTPIKQLIVTVELISGTRITQYTDEPKNVMESKIEYQIQNIITSEDTYKTLKVTYIPAAAQIQLPTTIMAYTVIAIAIASVTYVRYRYARRGVKVKEEDYVKAIRDLYIKEKDEYIKLRELINRYGEGEIDRKEYMDGKSKMKKGIEDLEKKIADLKLKVKSEQVKEKIREIEDEIKKLNALMERMEDLESKKLSKIVKRVEYQRLKDLNEKTYNRTIRRIELKINELIEIKL